MQIEPVEGGESQPNADRADVSPRQWTSQELLGDHAEAIILHAGETYRLRRTRNNRLILHK